MKRLCERRLQILTLLISFAGIVLCALVAGATQEPYDIDLKELKRPPLRRAKEQQSPHKAKTPVSTASSSKGENSSYVVRPGDHLYLILMQQYGLSNEAAEQLIPDIVRLNSLRNPKSLSVGQRLTIPLPAITDKAAQSSRQKPPHTPQPELETVQPEATSTPLLREVVAPPSQPCQLAREVAEQLGVRVSAFSTFLNAGSVSMSHDGLKMAVVCALAPPEAYTLERLLALKSVKLLVFNSDETPRRVIEGVAGALGIPLRMSNGDTSAELPLTYLFPAASAGKDLILTISPPLPAPKQP